MSRNAAHIAIQDLITTFQDCHEVALDVIQVGSICFETAMADERKREDLATLAY